MNTVELPSKQLWGICDELSVCDYEVMDEDDSKQYVVESLEDIIPFLYKQRFGKDYRELGWWLEPGAKEFVKDIEDKYWHNTLDTYELYHDPEFIKYVKEKYDTLVGVSPEQITVFENYLEYVIADMDEDDYKILMDESCGSVAYSIITDDETTVYDGWFDLPEYNEYEF